VLFLVVGEKKTTTSQRPFHNYYSNPFTLISIEVTNTMSLAASRTIVTRALARRAPLQHQQQKRGIIDYLTNYPDKVRSFHVLSRDKLKKTRMFPN
jgi:hypothetical protein